MSCMSLHHHTTEIYHDNDAIWTHVGTTQRITAITTYHLTNDDRRVLNVKRPVWTLLRPRDEDEHSKTARPTPTDARSISHESLTNTCTKMWKSALLLATMLFYRAFETLPQQLCDSLHCKHYKHRCAYLLSYCITVVRFKILQQQVTECSYHKKV